MNLIAGAQWRKVVEALNQNGALQAGTSMAVVHNMLKVFRMANNNNGRCSDLECYLIPIVTQLQRDQRFNRMSDKILTHIIALQWDKVIT